MIHINVADFGPGAPESIDLQAEVGEGPSGPLGTVLYLPIPLWAAPKQIDRIVNDLEGAYRESAELVVLRVHPQRQEEVRRSTAIDDVRARFENAPVIWLSWDGAEITVMDWGDPDQSLRLDGDGLTHALRAAELKTLLARTGVILPADETYHYEGPNGRHYESFVRVGTAIQGMDTLDSLAFWLLPEIAAAPVLILDTWTIISLGLNATRYLRDATGALGVEGALEIVAIECLRRYDEPPGDLVGRLSRLRDRLADRSYPPTAVVVMSVSSTGGTADNLADACRRAGLTVSSTLSLFAGKEAQGSFCQLDEITENWEANDCPHCKARSPTVRVLPDSYLLDLAATVRQVAISINDARPARTFFDRYADADAISVHRDEEVGERHHMIYVDVARMLETDEFATRLRAELSDLPEIDLIVSPTHTAGQRLAQMAGDELGVDSLCADPEQLLTLDEIDDRMLSGKKRILIVDDIVMTGTRLRRYRNWLSRHGVATAQDFELHFLAGVARPSSLSELRAVIDFTHNARFHYVELLLLPNWDQRECPWCNERELLRSFGAAAPDDQGLADRMRALEDTARGLQGELFMPWAAVMPRTDPWLLGPHSIFGARTEAELFAAVASSVQTLRANADLNERMTLPVAKVLDPAFTFKGRFYDTVITACLLRSTRRHDLRAAPVEQDLEDEVGNRLSEGADSSLQAELLFAIWRRHLPGLGTPEARAALEDPEAAQGIREVLAAAVGD